MSVAGDLRSSMAARGLPGRVVAVLPVCGGWMVLRAGQEVMVFRQSAQGTATKVTLLSSTESVQLK